MVFEFFSHDLRRCGEYSLTSTPDKPLFFPAVETVDITALVELLDKARVDEILRFGPLRLRIHRRTLVQNRLQAGERWVLFGRQLVIVYGAFVGLLQQLFVLETEIFSSDFKPGGTIGFLTVHGFNVGL